MREIHGMKFGGLQQKIFTMMLLFLAALIGVYTAASLVVQARLTAIVETTNEKQQTSINEVSEMTMEAVLAQSMTQMTALQAYIADDLFSDVRSSVYVLQTYATELFEHADDYAAHSYSPPLRENDGIPSVQMQHEEGVDPAASSSLGLVANMSEIMLSMFMNSEKLNSCFVATADGCILFADDRAGAYFDENGEICTFETRERPWYRQAAAAGELIFTGVELDAFTDILGLVCAAPVYQDGELVAVVGADVFLTSISDYVKEKSSGGEILCVIGAGGEVLFSPLTEGTLNRGKH